MRTIHKRLCNAVAVIVLLTLSASLLAQKPGRKPTPAASPLTSRQIADKIAKSLVVVFTQDIDGKPLAQGSGFFFGAGTDLLKRKSDDVLEDMKRELGLVSSIKMIPTSPSSRGTYVVSNLHVFKRAWNGKVKIVGSDATYQIKRVVGIDIQHDLCVFEVEGFSAPPLMVADPEKIAIGDDIFVGGSPRGLENTISRGIISSIRKDEGFVQIDAAISPGSSGGPVVDTAGNVVGVATSSLTSGQNLNFAVGGSYLLKLKLSWNTSVKETGAFAISDAENDGLIGKVKSVKKKVAEIEGPADDLYSITPRVDAYTLYNQEGNDTEATTFDDKGEFYSLFKTEYDSRGIRSGITVLTQGYEPTGRTYSDAQNLEIKLQQRYYGISRESEYKTKDGSNVKETVTYDRDGNEIERMRLSSSGRYSRLLFEYDDRGRRTVQKDIRDGKVFAITRYQYKIDRLGNWISQLAIVDIGEGIDPFEQKLTLREIVYY